MSRNARDWQKKYSPPVFPTPPCICRMPGVCSTFKLRDTGMSNDSCYLRTHITSKKIATCESMYDTMNIVLLATIRHVFLSCKDSVMTEECHRLLLIPAKYLIPPGILHKQLNLPVRNRGGSLVLSHI